MSFFGNEKFSQIQDSFVVVVGLGGVGSHAVNMLIRSGIKHIRVIDFDQVSLSSLNRHAVATLEDVGKSKAGCIDVLIANANSCKIEAVVSMFKQETAERLLEGRPAYVLDCIDDVNTKAALIAHCASHNLRVLTSMGAGGKADPTRLRIAPLSDCSNDPLATKIKWKLKKLGVSAESVTALFSIERTVSELLPLDEDQRKNPQDFGALDYMRIRVVPVLGTSPALFGQALASYVLCQLAGSGYEPETCEKLSHNLKHKLRQAFKNDEMRRFGTTRDIDLDDADIDFVVCQVWKSKCAITGRKFGGHSTSVLTRWDPEQPPTPYNLVLLLPERASELSSGSARLDPQVVARIQERLQWAKRMYAEEGVNYSNSRNMKRVEQTSPSRALNTSNTSHSLALRLLIYAGIALFSGYMR